MTNHDRELIVLAGRAAGTDIFYDDFHDGAPCYYAEDIDCNIMWNPLEDDGDAFRLSVKLGLAVTCTLSAKTSWAGIHCYDFAEDHGDDPLAATRRAIVRAAAEIGRTKP